MRSRRGSFFNSIAARGRRGASLVWILLLFPLVLTFSVVVMERLQTALIESQRHQDRTQARLLAESALFILQDELRAGGKLDWSRNPLVSGEIAGRGRYEARLSTDRTRLTCRGMVEGAQGRFSCEIDSAIAPTSQSTTLHVTALRYRLEPKR